MTIPTQPLDPEKQPALTRVDSYAEWREREGAPLVGGVFIEDMKGRGGGAVAAQGRRRQGRPVLPRRRQRRGRAHRRAAAGRLHRAAAAHVHRGHLRGVGSRLLFGVARGRRETDLRVGPGQLFRAPHQRLAPVLQRQPVAAGALVLGHRPAPDIPAVEQRALHLSTTTTTSTTATRASRTTSPAEARLYRGRVWETNFIPDIRKAAAVRVEEPGRRRHQRLHGHGLRPDGVPRVPLRIGLLPRSPTATAPARTSTSSRARATCSPSAATRSASVATGRKGASTSPAPARACGCTSTSTWAPRPPPTW